MALEHRSAETVQAEELADQQRRDNNRRIFIEGGREKLLDTLREVVGRAGTGSGENYKALHEHTTEELADLLNAAVEGF